MKKASFTTIIVLLGIALAGFADAQSGASVSVQPETFTKSLSRGEEWQDVIKVVNGSDAPLPVHLSLVRWDALDETGGVSFIEEQDDPSFDATHWFSIDETDMIVGGKEVREIPFTVRVPQNAEPGGKYVSLWVDTKVPDIYFGERPVRIIPRITALFLIDIPIIDIDGSDVSSGATIAEFAISERSRLMSSLASRVASLFKAPSTAFASSPSVSVDVLSGKPDGLVLRVENDEITHIRPSAKLTVRNAFGQDVANIETEPTTVLPGKIRQIPLSLAIKDIPLLPKALERQLALGRYSASVVISGVGDDPILASLAYWVFPWQSILFYILTILGGAIVIIRFRHRFVAAVRILLKGPQRRQIS